MTLFAECPALYPTYKKATATTNTGYRVMSRAVKVNNVKIFSEPYYMIKRVLMFISGVQEPVLVDFISQNKVKILH